MALRILVVDDASFVRDTIKRSLRASIPDAEIIEAPDGAKAQSLVKSQKPHLILSDWEMPRMSGEEFVTWLRSEQAFANIPFVMVTSRGDRDHVVSAIKAGVSDYLSKPFTPDELQKKVNKQLARLGYKPKQKQAATSGGFGSADILTGAAASAAEPKKAKSPPVNPFAAKATAPASRGSAAKPTAAKGASNFSGKASLRFANNVIADLQIRDLSLQALSGVIKRPEALPKLFDQASVDLEDKEGKAIARVNAYLHAIVAADPRPDASALKVTVRFVDNDPQKFEVLSKAIASA